MLYLYSTSLSLHASEISGMTIMIVSLWPVSSVYFASEWHQEQMNIYNNNKKKILKTGSNEGKMSEKQPKEERKARS